MKTDFFFEQREPDFPAIIRKEQNEKLHTLPAIGRQTDMIALRVRSAVPAFLQRAHWEPHSQVYMLLLHIRSNTDRKFSKIPP